MIKEEDHDTTMEKILEFGTNSFLRILPKIDLEVQPFILGIIYLYLYILLNRLLLLYAVYLDNSQQILFDMNAIQGKIIDFE